MTVSDWAAPAVTLDERPAMTNLLAAAGTTLIPAEVPATAEPSRAPGIASASDSRITETTTAVAPKPSARSVAISRLRAST